MTNAEIIESATAQLMSYTGYHFSTIALNAAVEAGLLEGDRFGIGSGIVITIANGFAIGEKEGKEINRVAISTFDPKQVGSLIKAKAIAAARAAVGCY